MTASDSTTVTDSRAVSHSDAEPAADAARDPRLDRPWPALWSIVVGFFMILLDTTIVTVAMPSIQAAFHSTLGAVLWVTSGYLFSYAVPMLLTGRLGDRFGLKQVYLVGLVVFTLASLWCGLSTTITMLVIARVVQGLGAAIIAPQTMSMVTRMFPPDKRGSAMAVWGAVAGVATFLGPLIGGGLTQTVGWSWIFIVNVPVGIVGFILAWKYVPNLSVRAHSFDWFGVVLSAIALFLLVFGIQEGDTYHWGTITDGLTLGSFNTHIPVTVPGMIIGGVVMMAAFVVWQHFTKREPLVPLELFKDRNFSLANIGIAAMGAILIALMLPFMIWLQQVKGLSPAMAAIEGVPLALFGMLLAKTAGDLMNRYNPRNLLVPGFVLMVIGTFWIRALIADPNSNLFVILIPLALMGIGSAGIWGPLSVAATRNLPPHFAGAGSGVFNETRQIGTVLGSAAISTLMNSRLGERIGAAARNSGGGPAPAGESSMAMANGPMPDFVKLPFSLGISDAMWLTVALAVLGLVVVAFVAKPTEKHGWS